MGVADMIKRSQFVVDSRGKKKAVLLDYVC